MVAQIKHKQNCVQKFSQFFASRIMHKKICQNLQMCLLLEKTILIFFQNFPMISLVEKGKNENGKIHYYSFKMANNVLKIWQNHLLLKPFHMVDAKFDLVLRPISHRNPAMPFLCTFNFLMCILFMTIKVLSFLTNCVILKEILELLERKRIFLE